MVGLYILFIIIALMTDYVIARKFADIAEMKGHEGGAYFWYTFLLGLIGMLMVVALPNENVIVVKNESTRTTSQAPIFIGAKDTKIPEGKGVHAWRCDCCNNMRTQSPCEHCGKE